MKTRKTVFSLLAMLVLMASLAIQVTPAQANQPLTTVSGNVFIQGTYAEIGIGPNGTFGTLVDAPAGFHPHGGGAGDRIGFVADYQKDGWGVGTPGFGGDYFVPGAPWEGFGIECTGGAAQNGGGAAGGPIAPVSLTEGAPGPLLTADWVGTVTICGSTMQVTHHYYMDPSWTYMMVDTTITNTGGSAVTALTFGRGVDPDNDQTWPGGSFVTKNEVVFQQPADGKAVVTAWGVGYPDMGLILGTDDTRAKATAQNATFGIDNATTLSAPVIGPVTADDAMQIAFDLGTLDPGASVTMTYYYGFNAGDLGVPGGGAPTITSIVPNSGPEAGGTTVVITGTNLTGGTVTFGGSTATCTVDSAAQITCVTPPHAAGAVDVAVTTPGGTVTSVGGFTYIPPPTITGVTPNAGPTTGGTTVTITGTNLTGGAFTFGGATATCTVAADGLSATCTTPPHGAGLVDVVVTTPGGTDTETGAFTFVSPPTIDAAPGGIVPNAGPTAGGTVVVITGTNLTGGTVTFGGLAAICTVDSATQITCTTPAHDAGLVDVAVTTLGGTATAAGGFTYVPLPTVTGGTSGTGAAPRLGVVGGGTSVTVTGTGFTGLGTGNATFTFGGLPATCTVNSDTSATCTTPAGVAGGLVHVAATTIGGTGAVVGDFYYVELSPVIGPTAGGQTVTITGVGFTGATVYFNGLYSARAACTVTSDLLLTCITPARPVGPTDVVIATLADGNVFLLDGYTYAPAPSIDCCGKDGCSPNTGSPLGGETVLINGQNLTGGTFTFGGVPAVCTVNSAGTQASCITPPHAPGLVDVVVTTIGGTATVGFTYGPYMYYFPLAVFGF